MAMRMAEQQLQQSGNANGQSMGANSAQESQPQTVRPQLEQRQRTNSDSAASEIEARRMIRDSISQQASGQAQMRALQDEPWRNAMVNVVNLVSRAFPNSASENSPQRTTRSSSAETQQHSESGQQ